MASTGYANNVRVTTIGGFSFGFDVRINVSSFSRSNNTLTVNGMSTTVRVNSGSEGSTFTGFEVIGHGDAPDGTRRYNTSLGSGTFARGGEYTTSSVSFTVGVNAGDTSISLRPHVTVNGGSGSAGQALAIPTVSAPTGSSINASLVKQTTARLNASVTGWGDNSTAGTGQRIEYRQQGSGTWINLAYSTATSHSRDLTGLKPNTTYEARTYALNGAGLGANSSTITFKTKPVTGVFPVLMALAG